MLRDTNTDEQLIIRKIIGDSISQRIYCCTDRHGILVYDVDGAFVRHDNFDGYNLLNKALALNENTLIMATDSGLFIYDCKEGTFRLADESLKKATSSALLLSQQSLLVAHTDGIRYVDFVNKADSFCVERISEDSLSYNRASSMSQDDSGAVWLGSTISGVVCTDINSLQMNKVQSFSLLDKGRISNILHQPNGLMWIGTFDQGLYCYSPSRNVFRAMDQTSDKEFVMKSPEIFYYDATSCFVKSLHQNRWRVFDAITGKEVPLPSDVIEKMRSISTPDICRQSDKIYIIAYRKSLVRKILGNSVEWVQSEFSQDMRTSLMCSELDSVNNCIWLGYMDDLRRVRYDSKGNVQSVESISSHPYFANRQIRQMRTLFIDSDATTVWVGSGEKGLYKLTITNRDAPLNEINIEHYHNIKEDPNSIPSNFISCIMRHSNGVLYVGTEQGGFAMLDESESKFKTFNQYCGLSNNVVKSMVCDDAGLMWVATNVGLNCFDVQTEQFQTYRMADGLPFEDFWYHSCKLPSGDLVFSGVNGLMSFDPKRLPKEETLPNVELTSLSVLSHNDKEERTDPINIKANQDEFIELDYNQNIFVVGVDVLYEKPSSNHKIQYKLLPLNDQWITLPELTNQIPFNGLPEAEYTLMVRASNFFGEWTEAEVLQIRINPPFYRSILAYAFYIISLLILLILVFKFTLRYKLLRRDLELEVFKKEKLEEMNEEKQRYFSNISHELKTPLTLISASVDSLIESTNNDKSSNRKLQLVKRQANKMMQLVDLALGDRLDELNLLQRQATTFAFHTFFDEILSDYLFMANYEKKSLEIDHNLTNVFVNADKSMIEKVLNNLLSNAFKYTQEGDKVTARYRLEGKNIVISISDTGYGIHERDIPHIFERFYQGKRSVHIAGTGIGLSFARRLVEMHSGQISVESELEKGSVFTVSLPIVSNIEAEPIATFDLESPFYKKKVELTEQVIDDMDIEHYIIEKKISNSIIYIVEDNVMMREFLVEMLSRYYHVKAFGNGQECLNAMEDSWPGLIVSDVMMPLMDGYELCKAVKTNISTSHIPIVLLTARGAVDERVLGLESGADAYIPKPFHTKHLLKSIEMLLIGRILLSERYQIGIPLSLGNSQGVRSKDNEFLERLLESFAENISNEEMDIEQLCKELCVSRSSLFLKVKALTNSTPTQLFRTYKLKKAADLLMEKEMNVKEVCFALGFKSRSTFGRLFTEKYGVAPSNYASSKAEK